MDYRDIRHDMDSACLALNEALSLAKRAYKKAGENPQLGYVVELNTDAITADMVKKLQELFYLTIPKERFEKKERGNRALATFDAQIGVMETGPDGAHVVLQEDIFERIFSALHRMHADADRLVPVISEELKKEREQGGDSNADQLIKEMSVEFAGENFGQAHMNVIPRRK